MTAQIVGGFVPLEAYDGADRVPAGTLDVVAVDCGGQADPSIGASRPAFATFDIGGHQPGGAGEGIVVGQDGASAMAQPVAAGAPSLATRSG